MKSILIADNRTELLATLEPILKHWGYRVLSTQSAEQITTFLQESELSLLIIGEGFLASLDKAADKKTRQKINSKNFPVVALKQDNAEAFDLKPNEVLDVPVELFDLFSFIQRQVEKHPRQNLRLKLKVPGMFSVDEEEFLLADVLTLSMRGLFFKATAKVTKGDRINVVFPLFGKNREIEVKSTVLYTLMPEAENNYFQGFGVGFDELSEQEEDQLQHYIKEHFLKEVSSSFDGVADFDKQQLKN